MHSSQPHSRPYASRDSSSYSHPTLRRQPQTSSHDSLISTNDEHQAPQLGSEDRAASNPVIAAAASARERVVNSYNRFCGHSDCNASGDGDCEHGILSPRASSVKGSWDDSTERGSGSYGGKFDSRGGDMVHGVLGDAITDGLLGEGRGRQGKDDGEQGIKHTSTTDWLAREHHVKGRRKMYVLMSKTRDNLSRDTALIVIYISYGGFS